MIDAPTRLLYVDTVRGAGENETSLHSLRKPLSLQTDLLLLLSREVDEMVILGSYQERNGCLVEAASLPVPLFDGVERAFPGQVEHKQDCYRIVAH